MILLVCARPIPVWLRTGLGLGPKHETLNDSFVFQFKLTSKMTRVFSFVGIVVPVYFIIIGMLAAIFIIILSLKHLTDNFMIENRR